MKRRETRKGLRTLVSATFLYSAVGGALIPGIFLELDLAIVLISLTLSASPTAAPRQALVAESSLALPPVLVELRHAESHALNPRHRMPAASTGQHAGPNMPLLRRHHAAPPDDPKTWSAFGTAYLRLPFLQRGRYKMKFTSTRHETASLRRAA